MANIKSVGSVPQVEIFRELKACIYVLFHFAVYAWYKLREWKSFWKRFLQQKKNQVFISVPDNNSDVKTSNVLSRKDKMKFLYLKCL